MNAALLDRLEELFSGQGARDYLGEEVSMATHMLQAADRAREAGAPRSLVAAALLHDVGHFTGLISGAELMAGTDNHHDEQGAAFLAEHFGPDVAEPVRLHVAAKRYLCAVRPDYFQRLSSASVYTLSVQGGPMNDAEVAEFAAHQHAQEAVLLRECDDAAKDPDRPTPAFAEFRGLLSGLIATSG